MYRLMVELLIFFFFTVWNVAESLAGLVREPMAEDKIFSSSSSSALLRMLCRPTISEIYVCSKRDFRKAKEKGYNPRELSQMLKNEGIIIPAYLIKRFFSEDENVSAPQKKETTPVKKHPTEKASFIVSDTSNENL